MSWLSDLLCGKQSNVTPEGPEEISPAAVTVAREALRATAVDCDQEETHDG